MARDKKVNKPVAEEVNKKKIEILDALRIKLDEKNQQIHEAAKIELAKLNKMHKYLELNTPAHIKDMTLDVFVTFAKNDPVYNKDLLVENIVDENLNPNTINEEQNFINTPFPSGSVSMATGKAKTKGRKRKGASKSTYKAQKTNKSNLETPIHTTNKRILEETPSQSFNSDEQFILHAANGTPLGPISASDISINFWKTFFQNQKQAN